MSGAVWNNYQLFEIQNTSVIANLGGVPRFTNHAGGVVSKVAGLGPGTRFFVDFVNDGLLGLNGYQIDFSGASQFTQRATGVTNLGGGTLVVDPNGATFTLLGGILDGGGLFDGTLVNTAGTVVVGDGLFSEVLTITANYTQGAGAKLRVGISTGPLFGSLDVGGTANIAGTVEVFSIDGTVPAANTERDILTAGTLIGTFAGDPPGYELTYPANQNKVVLKKT